MSTAAEVRDVDKANAEFWDELCGTTMARELGIRDHSPESLRRFDEAYFAFYPYLLKHARLDELAGRRVLEVGLGYGSLGQRIAAAGARYIGLDLARGPLAMMRHRLQGGGRPGTVIRGSILECPLPSESVDIVVSIGCFHHTGNVQRAIDETWRVLRPGGTAILMVYNRYSYLQWGRWPVATLRAFLHERGLSRSAGEVTESQRAAYDLDSSGRSAAETVFLSRRQLTTMLARFSSVSFRKENSQDHFALKVPLPFRLKIYAGIVIPRSWALSSVGRWWGLDLYIRATK
jgi:SAM-dependent methyltransferase